MTPPRPRSARGDGPALRHEILDATEDLLIETGSEDAVSIRAVAGRVGVTPPAIYRHFPDKQSLLFEVCSLQFTRLGEHLDAVMAMEADATARLEACGRAYVDFGLAHPEAYRIMFMGRSDGTPDAHRDDVLAAAGPFMALVDVVTDVAGELGSEREPLAIATVLWTAMHGITSLLISKPNFPWPPVDELVAEVCATHLRGTFGQE
ncbi:MAG: TetR/AcrR family transcriptional regulator [Acidimicrobiales bacterium]|nr:TetR/AcrR family transcriptional regulator [Acidimicrobiales bacterium]